MVVDQPRTLDARLGLARRFKADYGIESPLLVDDPADEAFERLYAPWPLRLYVVRGATLAWIAEPDGATFVVEPGGKHNVLSFRGEDGKCLAQDAGAAVPEEAKNRDVVWRALERKLARALEARVA